jgi:hypothetical protein
LLGPVELNRAQVYIKLNGEYHPIVVLNELLLPNSGHASDDRLLCQQDGATVQYVRDIMKLLLRETPICFIPNDVWLPKSPKINPVCYSV